MKFFYNKNLIIKKVDSDRYIIYSSISNKRMRVNNLVKIFLEYFIKNSDDNISIEMMKKYLFGKMKKDFQDNEIIKYIEILKQAGLLYESGDEMKKVEVETNKNIEEIFKNQKLIVAYIHLTMRCNFNCIYCYNRELESLHRDELDTLSWFKIIDELKNAGVRILNITGGEPLIYKDADVIIKKAKDCGFNITLLTNGSLLLNNYDKVIPYIDKLLLSLDSNDVFINSKNRSSIGFTQILKLINKIMKESPEKLVIRSVITKNNIDDVERFHNFLRDEYGVKKLIKNISMPNKVDEIRDVVPLKKLKTIPSEEIETVYNSYIICGASRSTIAISPNGDIYPCQLLMYPELKMGNIFSSDWMNLIELKRPNIFPVFLDKNIKCNKCMYKYYCGGGCPALSYELYGDFNSFLSFLCPYIKEEAKLRIIYKKCDWQYI